MDVTVESFGMRFPVVNVHPDGKCWVNEAGYLEATGRPVIGLMIELAHAGYRPTNETRGSLNGFSYRRYRTEGEN